MKMKGLKNNKIVQSLLALLVLGLALWTGQDLGQEPAQTGSDEPRSSQSATTSQGSQQVVEGEAYSAPEDVAAYIDQFGDLPKNYIRKAEAKAAGWIPEEGNLWEVTDHKSIGGDRFGNYEGQLPEDEAYREADVNYQGGPRGPERLVYSEDGDKIYYTKDHYDSFQTLKEVD